MMMTMILDSDDEDSDNKPAWVKNTLDWTI